MPFIRSLLFAILFYSGSVPYVVGTWLLSWVSDRAMYEGAEAWARYFRWLVRHVLGIRVRIVGAVPDEAVIVASKHQSAYETMAALYIFRRPAIVFKAELRKIPLWGRLVVRYGMIPIDRSGSAGALRAMVRAARGAAAAGRPIVIFPEGSRVPVGEAPPLKPGISAVYRALDLPVVPLALDSGRLWPRRRFVKQPGTITLAFGEPIPPGLDRRTFETRLHAAINKPPA